MLLSTNEIAQKWGVSVTWVTILCKQGRIPGVVRKGNRWYIPADAERPDDKRKNKNATKNSRFTFIDLFAGVGGFHQAMRYLGGECVMAAEINQECVKTYKLNFKTSEKEVRGDVKKIDPTSIAPFDVLCAGFPCQPFSKAGAQQGFQDKTRGNLFYTIMDILDAHPEVKFIILENVRNLADKSENWDIITSELMKRNFYITKEPIILSPSDFGIGGESCIKRYGEVLTTRPLKRKTIPVTMRPGADPEEIYYYFTVREWIDLPQAIEIRDSFRGKPQFTNKFLLDHCAKSYQLFAISTEEEYRLMVEINKAFGNLSATATDDNTAVYRINEQHSVIVADGFFTIANDAGEILDRISISSFAQRPRAGFKRIKAVIK